MSTISRRSALALLASAPTLGLAARRARAAAPADAFTVTAKLIEVPGKLPPDDLYDYAYVMKYEVQGGPRDKQVLYVAHYKPRQPRAKIKDKMKEFVAGKLRSFNPGDVHALKLTAELKKIWPGPLTDEYAAADRKSTRYWCLSADPA
jgi:hypothetical protein